MGTGAALEIVDVVAEKWGGRAHYRAPMHVLGEDEHGIWLWGPRGRAIRRGDEVVHTTREDSVALAPRGAWWFASWWLGHRAVELYVNINTPVERRGSDLVYVDLDLDVVRTVDGEASIVDQDEFAEHQVALGYPADLIARTEAEAATALRLVADRATPFDGAAAAAWAATARALDLPAG